AAGVEAAAEQHAERHVADAPQRHGVVEGLPEPAPGVGGRAFPEGPRPLGEIPPPLLPDLPLLPDQIVSGEEPPDPLEGSALPGHVTEAEKLLPDAGIESRPDPRRQERLFLGGEAERAAVECIVKRLDPQPIA